MNSREIIRKHPIVSYFILTYLVSWLGAFLVVAPKLLRGQPIPQLDGALMFPVMLVGPSLVGIGLTAIVDGRSGLRALFVRLGRWRVGPWWYAAALLIPPLLILGVLLSMYSVISAEYAPHVFPFGPLFGIVAGLLEEIGWTGFVFPRLRVRFGALPGGLLLGGLWALWHVPVVDFLGAASPHGSYWLPYFLAFAAILIPVRVLIVWLYSNTGSVSLAQLMHASSTGFLALLSPSPIAPAHEALWYAVYAVALWGVVALVVATFGADLRRRPELAAAV